MTARTTFCVALLYFVSGPLYAQTLRAFGFHSEALDTLPNKQVRVVTGEYEVYADGNVKDVVGGTAGATASGSLGLGYSSGRFIVNALVNAVGTATPLTENFGSALLAPAAGTSLNAGVLDARVRVLKLGSSSLGLHGYGSVSSARWQVDDAGTTFGVVTPGMGLGIFCQVLNIQAPPTGDEVVGRSLAAVIDVGAAVRGIAGDIAQTGNDGVRHTILGERKQRTWLGFEGGLTIQLNGLKAGLTLYAFPGDVPGLSDGQVTAGFSVQSSLLSGKITHPASASDVTRITRESY